MASINDIVSIDALLALQLVFLNRSNRLCWGGGGKHTPVWHDRNAARPNRFMGILTGFVVDDCGELTGLEKTISWPNLPWAPLPFQAFRLS